MAGAAAKPGAPFVLAFGGDEFDHRRFLLKELSHSAFYEAAVDVEGDGWSQIMFEFRLGGGDLSVKDTGAIVEFVLVAVNDPPGQGSPVGQGAKVMARHPATRELLPVGRAVLWRPADFETWRRDSGH